MKQIVLHASETWLAWKCGQSLNADAVHADETMEVTEMGSAAHAAVATLPERPDLPDIASRFDVPLEELDMLYGCAMQGWKVLEPFVGEGKAEYSMEHHFWPSSANKTIEIVLVGTADRFHKKDIEAFILDWKFGYLESDARHQLRAYGFMAVAEDPKLERVWVAIYYGRSGNLDAEWFTRQQLYDWWNELCARLMRSGASYETGPHCGRCSRRHDCPAIGKLQESALATLQDDKPIDMSQGKEIVGPKLADGLKLAGMIESQCKAFRALAKQYVQDHGTIPAGDGRVLSLIAANKRTIKTEKAWPILTEAMTTAELSEVVKVPIGAVERVVRDRTSVGKGAAVKEFGEKLEAAGAIETATSWSLREVKK